MNCTEFSGLNDPTIWAGIGFTFLFVLPGNIVPKQRQFKDTAYMGVKPFT